MNFQTTTQYQRCQALFNHIYPHFRNAGQQYQDILDQLVTPSTRTLELGCGRGSLARQQLTRAQFTAGIEPNLAALAQNQIVSYPVMAVGEQIPFAGASFDVVTSQWVVEHIEHPEHVFPEMTRVTRPGGHIVIFTTNWANYVPLLNYLLPHSLQTLLASRLLKRPERETFPAYYRANTYGRIAALAQRCGLEIRQCRYMMFPLRLLSRGETGQ
jgi:ubiquinone/menaquinone biosynthesis C-methylase UbiE